ncbi:MAG: hypothetical protein FOGNACKC_03475 [Anaerolineae bacterium]|nr:hypothetical protein [Anaerolineae bacterium]
MPTITVTPRVKKQLTNVSVGDKVRINSNGDLHVTAPESKEQILNERYGHLRDKTLTLTEASKKYGVPRGTLNSWVNQSKYLQPTDNDSYPATYNESEIAYLAEIWEDRRKIGSRAPLLDDDGLPYEIKHPNLAEYRRNKKS